MKSGEQPGASFRLTNPAPTLMETMRVVQQLEAEGKYRRTTTFGVSSNVTLDLLGIFLRKYGLLHGTRVEVRFGQYDDPLGDVDQFLRSETEYMLLFPFFDNLLPSFEAQAGGLPIETIVAKEEEFRQRLRMVLQRAASFKTVFCATLHRSRAALVPTMDAASSVLVRLDGALRQEVSLHPNARLLEMNEVITNVGRKHAFDDRFYFRAKAPYSHQALDEIAYAISSLSRGFGSHYLKALVIDCDNTLWGGIIGEDMMGGIKLGPYDYPGNVFWRIQHEILDLERNGVLLCLCSKNNPEDVDSVLGHHPHSVIRDEHLILKKVNWRDKVSNLREIATELNIGLDSIVFLDDSEFECDSVRSQLPEVRVVQVPRLLSTYPAVMQEVRDLFFVEGGSSESRSKTVQYRQRAEAETAKSHFASTEEFLASLNLKLRLRRDNAETVPRTSELTLKSNQFNVTTRRYGEVEIQRMIDDADVTVYSMEVGDKFGSAGLTGVLITRWHRDSVEVDSFLMSCRVIGRGIELAVWNEVKQDALRRGVSKICACYCPSPKNAQVADFFDRIGLTRVAESEAGVMYAAELSMFVPPKTPWIEVESVE